MYGDLHFKLHSCHFILEGFRILQWDHHIWGGGGVFYIKHFHRTIMGIFFFSVHYIIVLKTLTCIIHTQLAVTQPC